MYTLHTTQRLPIGPERAWEFLTDPSNLEKITPPEMDFRIVSGSERSMYPGQLIEYKVRPMPGFGTIWVSEITQVEEGKYFVDEQRSGPYAMWHHTHFVRPVDGGVEIEDLVRYKLPLGRFGSLFHGLLVKPQLQKIFAYRKARMEELFGKFDDHE